MTLTAIALSLAFQTPINSLRDPNEIEYQSVLSQLSFNQTLFVQMVGNIFYRGKNTPVVSNVSWSSSTVSDGANGTKPLLQAEIEENVNGVLVKRIVADGNTVWSYDLNTHEYSATSYGGYGATRPATYQGDLLSDLNAAAAGPTAYVTKLLRQIYNTGLPYASWMPGVVSVDLQQGPTVYDPVNPNWSYTPTASDYYYMYNGSPKRSIVFEVTPGNQGNGSPTSDELAAVYFSQMDQLGRVQRLTQLTIKPYTTPTFAASLFQPYSGSQTAGWKAIVAPRPTSN